MAKIYYAKGGSVEIKPKNGKKFGFDEMKGLLGMDKSDLIQYVTFGDRVIVCDEEAKIKQQPINVDASVIAVINHAIFPHDCIAGDVIIGEAKECYV